MGVVQAHIQPPDPARAPMRVVVYIVLLASGAATGALALRLWNVTPPGRVFWPALPALAILLVTAEYLLVRFRHGRDIDALNLVEAVLAPLLFAFPGDVAILTVAGAQVISALLRRNVAVKGAFNVAQWSLATAAGSATLAAVARGHTGIDLTTIGALVAGLAAVLVVNQVAFTLVLALASRERPRTTLRALAPVIVPGWLGGWIVNVLFGLLYVLAYDSEPLSVPLFAVPLFILHLAYRGYAGARSDRARLTGLHRAATALAAPLDPHDAVGPYLHEVAACFEARSAALVLRRRGERVVYRLDVAEGVVQERIEAEDSASLEGGLASLLGPVRITQAGRDPMSVALAAAGWHDCLTAPLLDDGRHAGALIVFDQHGLEGFATGELAVLDALARETVGTFAKWRLLDSVVAEQRKLSEIVGTTSDGITSIADDGTVLSWNFALERITGIPAELMVGRPDGLARLAPRTTTNRPVDFTRWVDSPQLPAELRITSTDGLDRRLSCSYSHAFGDDGRARTLVVVARDVTPAEEFQALREQFQRLAETAAAQRLVVDQLQEAVMPARPDVDGADLAVSYLASDPSAPTGGDLYDWQVLPDGDVHVAVVDVLGHGVAATKDALAVVHTLRVVAAEGTPLEHVVGRADELLRAQHPDLVATVVVARYNPRSGRVRVAAGGHPPALVVSGNGDVSQLPASGGAIGWPGAGSDTVAEALLGVDDALVLYTDGLIEARKNILEGMDALVENARVVSRLPAAELAAGLVDRSLAGADRRDDSLALVVRRTAVSLNADRMSWRIDPDAFSARNARRHLVRWLATRGVTADDAALVASELLTNAVRAARTSVLLAVTVEPDCVSIEVTDDGPGRPDLGARGAAAPVADAMTGRGLFIVRTVCEEVDVVSTGDGTSVRCRLAASGDRVRNGSGVDAGDR